MISVDRNGKYGLNLSPVLKAMKDEDMDALVAMEPHTVSVFLNYWNEIYSRIEFREFPSCVLILSSGDILAVNSKSKESAPWIREFVGRHAYPANEGESMVQVLARILREKGLANGMIGFELGFIPVNIMNWIRSELPRVVALDGEWILWQLRAVKTEKQLRFIRKAVNACEAGVNEMLRGWKEGQSIHNLLDRFEQVVREHGADFFSTYQKAIAKKWFPFSGRDQLLSEDFIIKTNDDREVHFDFLVRYQSYFSDWKRAIYLGTPPKTIVDLYDFEWMVVEAIAKEVKPGMTTIEAQETCDNLLKKQGMVNWWCIHSVGMEVHEEPLIGTAPIVSINGEVDKRKTIGFPGLIRGRNRKITFEPNVVVMVETQLIEDPYLMTKEGLRRLNTLPQKLFVV